MNAPKPRLSEEENRRLIRQAQAGQETARAALVEAHLRLVYSIVRRFRGRDPEDLFQVGCIGLLKAIDKFDFSYDVHFSTYAVPLIMGEIRRYLRDDAPLSVSRSLKERAAQVEKKRQEYLQQHGTEPLLSQIAAELSLSSEQVLAALEAVRPPVSIQEVVYQKDGDSLSREDGLADLSIDDSERLAEKISLQGLLEQLPPRLAYVLRARYFLDKTQTEVAAAMGISQVQVSRLEKQALGLLRGHLLRDEEASAGQ